MDVGAEHEERHGRGRGAEHVQRALQGLRQARSHERERCARGDGERPSWMSFASRRLGFLCSWTTNPSNGSSTRTTINGAGCLTSSHTDGPAGWAGNRGPDSRASSPSRKTRHLLRALV